MEEKKKLNWGETPFHNMSKEDLLKETQRMYSALRSIEGVLCACIDKNHPHWSEKGMGGKAVEKVRQILDNIHKEYDSTDIYYSFFRYASDLLFENNNFNIGDNWHICPECGQMIGVSNGEDCTGKLCSEVICGTDCKGVVRKICWEDFKTIKED